MRPAGRAPAGAGGGGEGPEFPAAQPPSTALVTQGFWSLTVTYSQRQRNEKALLSSMAHKWIHGPSPPWKLRTAAKALTTHTPTRKPPRSAGGQGGRGGRGKCPPRVGRRGWTVSRGPGGRSGFSVARPSQEVVSCWGCVNSKWLPVGGPKKQTRRWNLGLSKPRSRAGLTLQASGPEFWESSLSHSTASHRRGSWPRRAPLCCPLVPCPSVPVGRPGVDAQQPPALCVCSVPAPVGTVYSSGFF